MSKEILEKYIEQNNLSQAKVATQLGVSPAVVSQYLKGTYGGDVAKIDDLVLQLVSHEQEASKQHQGLNLGFVPTHQAKKVMASCKKCHVSGGLMVVVGDAGLGKTMALKRYAQDNSQVVMIEIDPTFTPKVLLIELCEALGIEPSRNTHDNMKNLVSKLTGAKKLLIVDEAELLSYKSLEILRRIQDKAEIALLLAGMPRLRANLRGSRGELKQIFSRVDFHHELKPLSQEDMAMLVESAIGTNEFNSLLFKLCDGNARTLSKILKESHSFAVHHQKPIDAEMIKQAYHQLIN